MDLPPPQPFWTEARLELNAWLERNAPSLAELYKGALTMVFNSEFPGRTRFVAHAVREIRNRLPDVVSGPQINTRVEYVNRLDQLAQRWSREGLPFDDSIPLENSVSVEADPTPDSIAISTRLFRDIAHLLKDHTEARETHEARTFRLFEGLAPENKDLGATLIPIVRQWRRVTDWFSAHAHDSGRLDREIQSAELIQNFETFETMLTALIGSFFTTLDTLDEILEETNS